MSAFKYRFDELMDQAAEAKPVAVPLGEALSLVRSHSVTSSACSTSRFGVWECTPGKWRRQVVQAEYCHFLAGEALFTPDDGEPMSLKAGDVAYFPQNSAGVWDIVTASRKVFIVFDEGARA